MKIECRRTSVLLLNAVLLEVSEQLSAEEALCRGKVHAVGHIKVCVAHAKTRLHLKGTKLHRE
jgi:hypothetical protein